MPCPEPLPVDETGDFPIELSERDAREIVRLLGLLSGALHDRVDVPLGQGGKDGRQELARRAQFVLKSRRLRSRYFKPAMFGEPAWDVLLHLYSTESTEGRQSIGRIADVVGAPLSTAIRWIDFLDRERLVEREIHPTDKRIVFIRLSPKARELLDSYLSDAPWLPAVRGTG